MSGTLSQWKKCWQEYPRLKLPDTDITVEGVSLAARNTGFRFGGSLKVMMDAGAATEMKEDSIFITHGHMDHVSSINQLIIDNSKNPTIYVPGRRKKIMIKGGRSEMSRSLKEILLDNIRSTYEMSTYKRQPRILERIRVKDTYPGDVFKINRDGGKDVIVRVIECHHTVPCVGYGFSVERDKMKPEFEYLHMEKMLPDDTPEMRAKKKELNMKKVSDLRQLRKEGIELSAKVTYDLVCYLGDTTHRVFDDEHVFSYRNIFIECTFFQKEHIGEANKDRHMHWDNLKPIVLSHPDNMFILYHFSQRYKIEEIRMFFANEAIENTYIWIPIDTKKVDVET